MNKKLKKKALGIPVYIIQIGYVIVSLFLIYIFNIVHIQIFLKSLLCFIIYIVFALLFFQNGWLIKIFWGTTYALLTCFSEFLIDYFVFTYLYRTPDTSLEDGLLLPIFGVSYAVILSLFVYLLMRRQPSHFYLSVTQTIVFIFIAILGMLSESLSVQFISRIYDFELGETLFFPAIATNFCMLIFSIVAFFYMYRLGISNSQNITMLKERQQIQLEEKQYVDLLELTRTLRELKHDMKFHLNTMQALAQKQEYEKLNVYIQDFDNQINQIHYLVSTGNTAIDCTLSPKINIAKEKNIPFDYTLILPENLPIRDIDLSVLLGNLVDNALEAAVLCDLPWIQLQIKPFNNMLSIYVRNSYRGTPATKGSLEHGLGVHRIKEIVEKYKGTSRIIPEADSFAVHILLPLEDF